MRKLWPAVAALSLVASAAGAQQQAGTPMAPAAEVTVGTAIENRMLAGAAESFPAGTGRLYCFSKVSNAAGADVEHVWYKGDTEMARIKLAINGSPWRTYSSKTLGDDAAGDWRCDVEHNGTVVQTARFKVTP